MKYFILLIIILFISVYQLQKENDLLLNVYEKGEDSSPVSIHHPRSSAKSVAIPPEAQDLASEGHQIEKSLTENNEMNDELNLDELTNQAEDHQHHLEAFESQAEYERELRKKMYQSGGDFMSLNKKRNVVTE